MAKAFSRLSVNLRERYLDKRRGLNSFHVRDSSGAGMEPSSRLFPNFSNLTEISETQSLLNFLLLSSITVGFASVPIV